MIASNLNLLLSLFKQNCHLSVESLLKTSIWQLCKRFCILQHSTLLAFLNVNTYSTIRLSAFPVRRPCFASFASTMASCILSTNKAPLWPLIAATMVLSRAEGDVHFVSKPHIPNPGEFNNEGKTTTIEVE